MLPGAPQTPPTASCLPIDERSPSTGGDGRNALFVVADGRFFPPRAETLSAVHDLRNTLKITGRWMGSHSIEVDAGINVDDSNRLLASVAKTREKENRKRNNPFKLRQ